MEEEAKRKKQFESWTRLIQRTIRKCGNVSAQEAMARVGIVDLNSVLVGDAKREDFVDWLLSEAEYCSHMLLLANGKVSIDASNALVIGYLWAPPGHTSLLDVERVVECANQRLKIAIESLRLIFGCQSVRIDRQWTKRWNDIRRIAAGFAAKEQLGSINDENEAPNDGEMEVKSFCELMKDERRRRELYRFGFVDTMHRLLTKMTGLKWNLDALGDTPCTVDEVLSIVDDAPTARSISDPGIPELFFEMFRRAFFKLGFADKHKVMMYVYEKYGPVLWHLNDAQFDSGLASIITKLGNHGATKECKKDLAAEFSWYFTISMKYATWRLLFAASRIPKIVPMMVQVLHQLLPVTTLRSHDDGPRLFMISCQRFIANENAVERENDGNVVRLMKTLMTTRRLQGHCIGRSIFNKMESITNLILPALRSNPRLALRLLLSTVNNGNDCGVKWSGDVPEGEGTISIAKMTAAIAEAITESKEQEEKRLGYETLDELFKIWRQYKDLEVTPAAKEWLEGRMEKTPWMVRCFVFRSLRYFVWTKVPLPACLIGMCDLDTYGYTTVECGDLMTGGAFKIRCGFITLLQLAQASVTMADDILRLARFDRVISKIRSNELADPMIQAVAHVLAESEMVEDWKVSMRVLAVLFDRLWAEEASGLKDQYGIEAVSIGIRMVSPVVKLCEAMLLMLASNTMAISTTICVKNFSIVIPDLVLQRVMQSDNPMAKVFAFTFLYLSASQLTQAKDLSPADMETLKVVVQKLDEQKAAAKVELAEAAEKIQKNGK